jgi:hypothetical protein
MVKTTYRKSLNVCGIDHNLVPPFSFHLSGGCDSSVNQQLSDASVQRWWVGERERVLLVRRWQIPLAVARWSKQGEWVSEREQSFLCCWKEGVLVISSSQCRRKCVELMRVPRPCFSLYDGHQPLFFLCPSRERESPLSLTGIEQQSPV